MPPVAPSGRRPATYWYCTVYVVKPTVIRLRTLARLPLIHAPRAVRAPFESIPAVACARTLTDFDMTLPAALAHGPARRHCVSRDAVSILELVIEERGKTFLDFLERAL